MRLKPLLTKWLFLVGAMAVPLGAFAENFTLEPAEADFGQVQVGGQLGEPATQTFTLTSTEDDDLLIHTIMIWDDSTGPFETTGLPTFPRYMFRGETLDIEVTFTPELEADLDGSFIIVSNAIAPNGFKEVFLSGTGVEPAISVSPLQYDFGDVEVGTTETTFITIGNPGKNKDLEITGGSLAGDPAFSIAVAGTEATDPEPLLIPPGIYFDLPIAFSPTATGLVAAEFVIESDAALYPSVSVLLSGTGVPDDPPTSVSVADILAEFDASVANSTLEGDGPGGSANGRLGALRNMIDACGDLIDAGEVEQACQQLQDAADRCDGQEPPPDFVSGDAAAALNALIHELLEELGCG